MTFWTDSSPQPAAWGDDLLHAVARAHERRPRADAVGTARFGRTVASAFGTHPVRLAVDVAAHGASRHVAILIRHGARLGGLSSAGEGQMVSL